MIDKEQLVKLLEELYAESGLSEDFQSYKDESTYDILVLFWKDVQNGLLPPLPEELAGSFDNLQLEDFRIAPGVGDYEGTGALTTFLESVNQLLGGGLGFENRQEAYQAIQDIYPEGYGLEELVGPPPLSIMEKRSEGYTETEDRPSLQERKAGEKGISDSGDPFGKEPIEVDESIPPNSWHDATTNTWRPMDEWGESPLETDKVIPDVVGPGGLDAYSEDIAQWESEKPTFTGYQASDAPQRKESFKFKGPPEPQYQLKAPEGAQLMYIEETGEYFLAIEGDIDDTEKDIIFVYDIPEEYNLSDITDWEGPQDITDRAFEGVGKSSEQMEAEVRNSLSPIIIATRDDFDAGFYNDDRLVTVAATVSQIDELIAGNAEDIAAGFFNARTNMNSQDLHYHRLLQNDHYVAEVVAIQMLYGGTDTMDFATAEGIFRENSTRYNDIILEEFGDDAHRAEAIMSSEKLKKVNRSLYDAELTDKKANLIDLAKENGVDIPNVAVDYIADMWRKGLWSDNEVTSQFASVTDSYFEGDMDEGLNKAIAGADYQKITRGEDEIQSLLDTYLPSSMHASFDMKTEAGKYRNQKGYRQKLIGKLKELRTSEYDMYDGDIAWSTIVAGKRRLAENILGVQLNEGSAEQEIDPVLDHIIRLNDNGEAQGYLRNVGLERGYAKTEGDLMKSMMGSFGGGVVSSQAYGES